MGLAWRLAAGSLAAVGLVVVGCTAYVGVTWFRYGSPARPRSQERDELIDRFMPAFDVVDRHHTEVHAPAAITLAAAREMDLFRLPLVRAVFKARELILRARPVPPPPRGLVAAAQSLGWVLLAEVPGRELVFGAVTRPWQANVTFRSIPAASFAAFNEPDYVKITWNLRADAIDASRSIFRTETRAVATNGSARTKFRRYWSFFAPGIAVIRRMSLGPVKTDAERRARTRVKLARANLVVARGSQR
jgi:hypothetical protein